ncbi:MAG: DUF1360 domain-containing protein [Chloroflexota bacterium]|nr:DUF1360 domain-containing protein [Chloroflexota bacterium]
MEQRPHGAYALITGVYLAIFGAVAAAVGRNRKLSAETPPPRDLVLLGLATYRLTRILSADAVTSVVRQPFVEEGKGEEKIEGTQEQPKGSGLQRAIGQLVTCPWCTSAWAGAFNVYLFTLFPRIGRLLLLSLASSGIANLLDPVFPLLNYLSGWVQNKQQGQGQGQGGNG